MFWRKRIAIPEPNVPADWIERSLWQLWGPPSNHIAGEASYQTALATIVGATCNTGYCVPVPVTFIREPDNPYDRNACRAELHGVRIGYIRREFASQISPVLDEARCTRFGVCGVVRGGSLRAPNLGVHVWLDRRLTPGPSITVADDPWVAAWPPTGREVVRLL